MPVLVVEPQGDVESTAGSWEVVDQPFWLHASALWTVGSLARDVGGPTRGDGGDHSSLLGRRFSFQWKSASAEVRRVAGWAATGGRMGAHFEASWRDGPQIETVQPGWADDDDEVMFDSDEDAASQARQVLAQAKASAEEAVGMRKRHQPNPASPEPKVQRQQEEVSPDVQVRAVGNARRVQTPTSGRAKDQRSAEAELAAKGASEQARAAERAAKGARAAPKVRMSDDLEAMLSLSLIHI